ncbi:hypothetical protein PCASD_05159 [Puccinia coronata f. sp. avenae]|uniref:Reverse transcriptase RNase H-like domain-containing protein n=1 Tax=Puccinia coronata f. sp. avenae TaxID=200324 RepID=A0A2N5V3L6_9BASI|nr:hypothetical protein PCASD_05159 [Puccinia coronata f. sp. avenae]
MESNKLDTFMDWPYPRNQKELGRFLGYLNFYRKFIKRFSSLAAPLTSLTKEKSRILHVNSSKYALSAVLSQHDASGTLRPVSFLSKKWTEKESSWQCHDQELGAIVQAFVEWRAWLIDTREPVEVFSDHANLKYFTSNQNLSDRQARGAAFLSLFNFVIKHIPGRLNPADPPTRCPNYVPPGASLDLEDPRIDVGEVAVPSVPSVVPDMSAKSQYPSFCAPSAKLKALLQAAYAAEPPDPEEVDDLEFRGGLWWIRDRVFVPLGLRP